MTDTLASWINWVLTLVFGIMFAYGTSPFVLALVGAARMPLNTPRPRRRALAGLTVFYAAVVLLFLGTEGTLATFLAPTEPTKERATAILTLGVVTAGLTRASAITYSSTMARPLFALILATIAMLPWARQTFDVLGRLKDLYAALDPDLPHVQVAATFLVFALLEGGIRLVWRVVPEVRVVSRRDLRETLEAGERYALRAVDRRDVVELFAREAERVILAHGLTDLRWKTHSAPREIVSAIVRALAERIHSQTGRHSDHQFEACTALEQASFEGRARQELARLHRDGRVTVVCANDHQMAARLETGLNVPVIRIPRGVGVERYLVINARSAVVSWPSRGRRGQSYESAPSDVASIIEDPTRIVRYLTEIEGLQRAYGR
jgi:hypothetical protein